MELIYRKQMKTKGKITSDGGISVTKIMMEVIWAILTGKDIHPWIERGRDQEFCLELTELESPITMTEGKSNRLDHTRPLSLYSMIPSLLSRKHVLGIQIRSNQISRSVVSNSATPWITARQASLSITNSQSSLRLTSIKSVMPSSHLILCHPLLLLPPIPPSISLFQWVNSSHEVAKVLEFQL